MEFAFSEEQQQLREAARAVLRARSTPERVRAAMESELGYDPELWRELAGELGFAAVLTPEAQGGLGLGQVEVVALVEVMGEFLLCAPFFSSVCLATNAILLTASEAQRQALLPELGEGRRVATLAFAERDAEKGAAGVRACFRREGDSFVLSGAKSFVPDGHSADLLLVPAREAGSEGSAGVALFALAGDTAGLSRRALPTMDATRPLAELELDEVRVPQSAMLGDAANAWPALARTLDLAALALAAEQVGGAQRCLELSVAYSKERVQYGRVIGSFQALKHKMADVMVRVEAARSAVYYAACAAAEGQGSFPLLASMARATASEAYRRAAGEAIQVFGGVGFTWEYDLHLYLKRAYSSAVLLGDADHHKERIAQEIGL